MKKNKSEGYKERRISRQEAIDKGILFDVPDFILKFVGIKVPTGVTNSVLEKIDEYHLSKLVSILQTMALKIVENNTPKSIMFFEFQGDEYLCLCGPNDDGKSPVFTIVKVKVSVDELKEGESNGLL